ncbi:LCP family protein [Levilinea saccharolytica]|uniref:LCP family protein n=1 Tax=Levilinea saccharolytica TaxID=229921 RepID=UPI001364DACE|nr:LCP family protein [Levilinea saccharolytica]
MSRSQIRMARRRQPLDRLTIILLVVFAVVAVITAVLGFIVVRNLVNSWTMTSDFGAQPEISNDPNAIPALPGTLPGGVSATDPLQPAGGPTPEPWDGASRVNVLFLGLDYRDWEAGETPRSDTMILFTYDPLTNSAGMLSIPRDLWVNIPGFDYAKINTAYYLGEIYKLPGGGPALASKTVELLLGVPVHFYAQVDFNTFVRIIDELGGLDINIPNKIYVDPVGPREPVWLYPGVQTLDGAATLAFARARHTEGDDFTRAKNQQLVIMTIREQVLSLNMLPTLVAKAPALYQELSSGVRTNLNFQQIMKLGISIMEVPDKQIKRAVINESAVSFATSPDGLAILIPVPDKIRLLRDKIFTTSGPVAPAAVANITPQAGQTDVQGAELTALMAEEKARVAVQNGTQTPDLASRTANFFRSQGLNVVEETNADRVYSATTLIVVNGKPYTIKHLAEQMGVKTENIFNRYDPNAYADVIVILGNDWAQSNPMP